jgi:hypothetical protein
MWVDNLFSDSGNQCEMFNAYLLSTGETHWDVQEPDEPYVAAIIFNYPHQ